jgi:polysaccharide biosynthesis/export protein
MRFIFLFVVAGFVLLLSSCRTQRAITNYIEDMKDTASKKTFYITEPRIQKNDQLSISISSLSLDNETDQKYNPVASTGFNQQAPQLFGYLVDQKGEIEIPRVGIIHAEGLTKDQLAAIIKDRLRGQLTEPTVIIRFVNFRVMVMGEVGRPGVQGVSVENLNILEALAMAGDITLFGNKKQVKVVREINGQRQVGIIDVSSSSMFESPYYQLKQNDVVLVEATKYKMAQTEQQRVSQQLGFALSIITSIALLYNIFR